MRPEVQAAGARLRLDSATARVLKAFDDVGVESILLKGASNRQWLGDAADGRWSSDCDLLIRPGDTEAAGGAMAALGFVGDLDASRLPSWWREQEISFTRSDDWVVIELHRTLRGVRIDDRRAWSLLSAGAERIIVGGYPASALGIPARAMHVAMNAAHHGSNWWTGLRDLERALEIARDETWQLAAQLAHDLDALDTFIAGLALVPVGRALIAHLGLEASPRVEVALLGQSARDPALTVERFAQADNLRMRLSIVRHKLFPPRTFMRHWSPLARRGPVSLSVAYVWRPVWILTRAPAGLRAWNKARRATRPTRKRSAARP